MIFISLILQVGLVLRSQLVTILRDAGMAGAIIKSPSWKALSEINEKELVQDEADYVRSESLSLSSAPNQVCMARIYTCTVQL